MLGFIFQDRRSGVFSVRTGQGLRAPKRAPQAGDPDLEPDEIQAAIDRAEQKLRELTENQPAAKRSAKMLAALPNAADAYRRQIEKATLGPLVRPGRCFGGFWAHPSCP